MNTEIPENPLMERNGKASSSVFLRIVLALVLLGIPILAALAAVGVVCFFTPRQYYSRVFMEVKATPDTCTFVPSKPVSQDAPETNLQSSLVQILQSKGILYPVIDNLKLVDAWSAQEGGNILPKEEVYRMLRERMVVTAVRNTDLVEIGVFSTDRVEASNIANMTAVIYLKTRQDDYYQLRDAGLEQLREEVRRQVKNMEALQSKMQGVQREWGIIDPNPGELNALVSGTAGLQLNESQREEYNKNKTDYLSARKLLEAVETRLATETVQSCKAFFGAKIWEKAEPSIYPAKPNVNEMMLHAATVGTLLGLILSGIYLFRTRCTRNPC